MGDHFVLLVDRLITESTLEAALESQKRSMEVASSAVKDTEVDVSVVNMDIGDMRSQGKLVQCRICHDEDEFSTMETPCLCSGSLKYAHRQCIQRWCNEKGDITCEICLQQFKPGYTAPPPLFRLGRLRMNFRRNWEISRRDLQLHNATQIVRVVSPDQNLADFTCDQCSASAIFCSISIFILIILILKHALSLLEMIGSVEYSLPIYMLLLARILGVTLSIYVMRRTVNFVQQQRQQRLVEPRTASGSQYSNQNDQQALQRQPQVAPV
ncbi:uncharacterized protein LOC129322898 isoform X2 [Prosopis cineraria]|uniref:uncharacterized protein LOC129322898 isoform X2 n=1 Tax=Prosopis cineraria TaxID=364024 RepID=UPI00240F6B98|nr:uncharacterized protein LOC129322898 isoform X2 [Prosopis cineraria]